MCLSKITKFNLGEMLLFIDFFFPLLVHSTSFQTENSVSSAWDAFSSAVCVFNSSILFRNILHSCLLPVLCLSSGYPSLSSSLPCANREGTEMLILRLAEVTFFLSLISLSLSLSHGSLAVFSSQLSSSTYLSVFLSIVQVSSVYFLIKVLS